MGIRFAIVYIYGPLKIFILPRDELPVSLLILYMPFCFFFFLDQFCQRLGYHKDSMLIPQLDLVLVILFSIQ